MGEKQFGGETRFFIDGKPIGTCHHCSLSVPDYDILEHNKSVFQQKSYTLTGTVKVSEDFLRKLQNRRHKNRLTRKALLYAVTHGFIVRIYGKTENGNNVELFINRPKALRWLFKHCPFVPTFRVFDRDGSIRMIKKGRIH